MLNLIFNMKYFVSLIFLSLMALSCKQEVKSISSHSAGSMADLSYNSAIGFQLLSSNCFACHNPNPLVTFQIAPTMADIKLSYFENYAEKERFIQKLTEFMTEPSLENSLMKDAIDQYGLMPKMNFSEEDLKHIASYVYQSTIENENWYATVFPVEKSKYELDDSQLSAKDKGLKLAMATKGVLGKNLLEAIQQQGTSGAITFCNTRAIKLTDSMSVELGAKIKRVSDRNRNPDNKANQAELKYIQNGKIQLTAGNKMEPLVIEASDHYTAYYPIITNNMCLQCHGAPDREIQPEVINLLRTLYPDDLAIGFKEGDLRGIWVVELEK